MSEKAKLIRGDPPKIDFKKKGEPPKNEKILSLKKIRKIFLKLFFKIIIIWSFLMLHCS